MSRLKYIAAPFNVAGPHHRSELKSKQQQDELR
jgi:hypothetical protein